MTTTLRQIAIQAIKGELEISGSEISAERMKVCKTCPNFKPIARQCKLCGCFMVAKTKLLHAGCPINKW